MSNPFASDAEPSLGHPGETPAPPSEALAAVDTDPGSSEDVTATLAELEHKLLELERELSTIETADTSAPAEQQTGVGQATVSDSPETPGSEAEAVADSEPRLTSAQAGQPAATLIDESAPGFETAAQTTAADQPEPASAAEPARLIDEVLEPEPPVTESGAPSGSTVIAELEGFRERLEGFMQELSEDYREMLSRLTTEATEVAAQSDAPEAPEVHEPAAPIERPPAPVEPPEPAIITDDSPALLDVLPLAEPQEPTPVESAVPQPSPATLGRPGYVETAQAPEVADSPARADEPSSTGQQPPPVEPALLEPSPATFGQPTYFEAAHAFSADDDAQAPEVSFHAPPDLHHAPIPSAGAEAPVQSEAAFDQPAQAPQSPGAEPSPEDEAVFVDHVEIGVGPFYDIAALSAFDREIARLPNVTETAVRRFEASHAVIDLYLTAPTALVGELRSVVTPFKVRQLAASRLELTFDES
jgi:hypothetical protein